VFIPQVFIAGFFPAHFFWPIVAIITVGVALGLFKMTNALDDRVWKVWQAVLGLIGLAMLPQTLCMAFVPTTTSAMPALTGALLGVSYVALVPTHPPQSSLHVPSIEYYFVRGLVRATW
jgi:hypothetical protein